MMRWTMLRSCVPAAVGLGLVAALCASAAGAQPADAERHKQWMNDASDAQEDFRFALTDNNQKAAVDALTNLQTLMTRTAEYWATRKADDGVKLAKETGSLASAALVSAKAGNLSAAREPFEKMGATCNACHELQLQKR